MGRKKSNKQTNKQPPDVDSTNCATETTPKMVVQVALILMTANVIHEVYWFCFKSI